MIAYLQGTLKRKHEDHVVVDVAGVGYEVYLPQFVRRTYDDKVEGQEVQLEIYYHASERQIRPILFGFNHPHEKQFFEKIIQVEDVGPIKAVRALALSVSTIANAIESDNVATLRRLPGIGERTANKMIATLRGKCIEEALLRDEGYDSVARPKPPAPHDELKGDALEILLALGHRRADAELKIEAVIDQHPELHSPEDLIREVYRRERT
ncbi:MAG TPA: Holliday junction branch migration protein RuvA [Chloroflexota bacterium]|jgi:Holliday junction DNA helicase RuvA|nr:Holliday junction branch migration protein RuvA [Chloroflexota bacterium]